MSNNNNNVVGNVSYVKRIIVDGEEPIEQEVLLKTKRQHRFKEKYFTMFQGDFMNKKLTIKDFKDLFGQKTELLFFLLNNMQTDNTIHLKQKSIAGALGINKGNLSRYIKQFEDVGLVSVVEGHICFNNQFVYKGKVEKHQLSS
jgi:ssDNA-specific exonuclease RecJ